MCVISELTRQVFSRLIFCVFLALQTAFSDFTQPVLCFVFDCVHFQYNVRCACGLLLRAAPGRRFGFRATGTARLTRNRGRKG